MRIRLCIENAAGDTLAEDWGENQAALVHTREYKPGDYIALETEAPGHLVVALEDSIPPAFVYMGGGRHTMAVPFGEKRAYYSPKSFTGAVHLLRARRATGQEIAAYKNLALNPLDCHENERLFPHSRANVETRGEAVFASRNAIDGICENRGHGHWPYQSWGINRDPSAEMRIDFGRLVCLDKAVLITRADFPHDSWWVSGTLEFSDGSAVNFPLIKTTAAQTVEFSARSVTWAALKRLIKADDDSPFPALSQIELWGREHGKGEEN